VKGLALALAPLGTLFVGVLFAHVVDEPLRRREPYLPGIVASLFFAITLLFTWQLSTRELPIEYQLVGSNVELVITELGIFVAVAATLAGLLVSIYTIASDEHAGGSEVYFPLVFALVAGVIGIGFANDLFTLYVFFELMAVATYALVPFDVGRAEAVEAGFKYLVMNAVGAVLAIFGISLIFTTAGGTDAGATLALGELQTQLAGMTEPEIYPVYAGLLFITIGFGVKSALVPLHTWVPDAYSEAPSGISALLAGIATPAAVIAMIKCLAVFPLDTVPVGLMLMVFAVVTMTVGNLLALQQSDVKRLLAYSSIPHIGYVLFGFGIGFHYGFDIAFDGALFHILANVFMKGGAFLAVGVVLYQLRNTELAGVRDLESLEGIAYRMPVAAVTLSVAVLALAGVPPLAGFWGKLFIVLGAARVSDVGIGAVLALIVIGNSFLSLGYYLPLIKHMVARPDEGGVIESVQRAPTMLALPLALATLAMIVLGILPALGLEIVHPAVNYLVDLAGTAGFLGVMPW
jgi:proton-translocating NADH-quinone oxidoreductase chain N